MPSGDGLMKFKYSIGAYVRDEVEVEKPWV